MDDLSEEVKLISAKVLIKNLINKYSFLNIGKYFSLDGSQNYLVFQPLSSYFTSKTGKFIYGNLKECQKKVLHLHLQQTIVSIQK